MTQTFYDVLDVSPDASTAEIRTAYRERLKESHPDLSDDDDANEATKRIIRARDVLTDETERERYDSIGHAEYVGDSDAAVDEDDVSDAAAAARRAGWSDTGATSRDSGSTSSHTGGRRRARQRRRRERTAQERVSRERSDGSADDSTHTGTASNGTASTGNTSNGTASTDGGSATAGSTGAGGVSGSARSWNGSGGYSVRQRHGTGPQRRRLIPGADSLPLLATAFVLYPPMLFSALFPPFPLVVNVVVGLCTIFLVGYLQSRPEVGVAVFGGWSLLTPLLFVALGVPLTGLVGIVGLAGTWLPLGLSALTLTIIEL